MSTAFILPKYADIARNRRSSSAAMAATGALAEERLQARVDKVAVGINVANVATAKESRV